MLQATIGFCKNEYAASALEYALIAALVALVIVSGLGLVGNTLSKLFNLVGSEVSNITPGA